MLSLTIKAEGQTMFDLECAVEEALKNIRAENTSGFNGNDTGDFSFVIQLKE